MLSLYLGLFSVFLFTICSNKVFTNIQDEKQLAQQNISAKYLSKMFKQNMRMLTARL
jgi:hypothetical protein